MKAIKSVLVGALVALLGSSAWADQTINVEVNGTSKTLNPITTERPSGVTQSQYWGTEKTDANGVIESVSTTGGSGSRANSTTTTITLTGKAGKATVRVYCARNSTNPTSTSAGATLANTITINATAAPTYEEIDCGKVNISQNETNNLCWTEGDVVHYLKDSDVNLGAPESKQHDMEIAEIVVTNGFVCITGAGHDGDTKVKLLSADGKKLYVYEVSAITITLSKTVKTWNESDHPKYDANNKSNATISIISHILNNPKPKIPNVLFFGTACKAHGLGADEVCEALNGIREVASVDWYMFLNANEGEKGNGCENYGHIDYQGTKITASGLGVTFDNSEHYTLKSFYYWFQKILTDPATSNAYDYIVIETDGSRLASEYAASARAGSTKSPYEEQVAKLLKPFYADGRVIWIMDNGYDYPEYITRAGNNGAETNLGKIFAYGDKKEHPTYGDYVVNNVTLKNSSGNGQYIELLNNDQWMGLLGIYDPTAYLAGGTATNSYANVTILNSTGTGTATVTTMCARGNPGHTIYYGHADTIGSTIKGMIKPVEYTTDLADTVLQVQNLGNEDTMTIVDDANSVRLYKWTKSLTPGPQDDPYAKGWEQVSAKDAGITKTGNSISNNVSGITNECYTLLQIDIVISDDFLTTAIAKKEADPDWKGIEKAGDYDTSHKWKVNPNDGDAKITVWRGQGESKVLAQTSAATMANAWEMVENKGWTVEAADASMTYDGTGTNITFVVKDLDGNIIDSSKYTVAYSNKESTVWGPINSYTNATDGAQDVAVLITMKSGSGFDPEPQTDSAKVTINLREVTLTAHSGNWLYDGYEHKTNGWEVTSGSFAPGEGVKEPVTMTDDSKITNAGHTNNVIKADALVVTNRANESVTQNYDITLMNGRLTVSGIDITASAEDVEKEYDGIKTNITVEIADAYKSKGNFQIRYAYDYIEHTNDTPRTGLVQMVRPGNAPKDEDFTLTSSPKFMDAGTNKVWYQIVDLNGNYSNYYGSAYIRITPRSVHFTFPKAVKPYDGGTTYAQGLATNLIGKADNMVGEECFDCTATGTFTSANVGAGEDYFHLNNVTIDGKNNAFKRNYVITYDGDDDQLVPGEITVIPMTIGGVKQPGTAGEQIPVEPTDDTTWTNGAVSVEKVYDAEATNIVVEVTDPAAGATVYYCYDNGGKPAGDWKTYENFPGYTDVTNTAPVWYKVEYPNYLPVTNRAFVTITPAQILGKKTANKPWATATSVEIWIDDLPQGGSTNIIVESDLLGSDQPTYRYSVKDPAKGAEWVDAASFEGFKLPTLATNVWCEVSGGSNYLPTNVVAHVAIWQREAEIEGKDSVGNAKEIQKALETNANKYKTSEHEYVKLRVTITPADEVPADDFVGRKIRTTKTEADKQVDAIVAAASAKAKVAKEEIVSALVDLVLERTYDKTAGDALDHGSYNESDWDDIGANGDNTDLYKFEFDYNKPSGYDLIGVYKYHNGAKKLREGSNQADCYKITTKGGKQVLTVWLKEFCLAGPVFMPHPAPKPTSGCQPQPDLVKETAWIYEWKFTGKTTNGVKIEGQTVSWGSNCQPGGSKTYGDEAIRVPSTLKIQGYTAKCIPACEDISTADFAGDGEVFWLTKPFKAAFDEDSGLSGLAGHVIAKSGNKYELAGRFSGADDDAGEFYDLVFAGIGSYSKSKLRVSSVSGSFAGVMTVPHYHKYDKTLNGCPEAQIWNCDQSDYAGAPETVAFGKWSMKYMSTASKKYLKDGTRPKAKNGAKWH